jgi:hypothetical protein
MRQRFLSLTAGDWQGLPDRVRAPQRALDSIAATLIELFAVVLRMRARGLFIVRGKWRGKYAAFVNFRLFYCSICADFSRCNWVIAAFLFEQALAFYQLRLATAWRQKMWDDCDNGSTSPTER